MLYNHKCVKLHERIVNMVNCSVILGEISYQGKTYTAIREIHHDGVWKLVFVKDNERILMLIH
ncbi:hypothetical protein AMI01nite_56010 [Aneurinibacillus migulanus]|nr:hypothetical protein AMI01nite_56010 [Aneurinibacillus migulanus]